MKIARRLGCALFCAALGSALLAGDIHGEVVVKDRKGKPQNLAKDPVVVFVEGLTAAIPAAATAEQYVMNTVRKQFTPRVMAVPKGATVRFPNSDPIIHNVFSVSGKNRFDAGRYSRGEGAEHTFRYPGVARIYCNVHHHMNAIIYVVDNPFFTTADAGGRFTLTGLPDGEYTIAAFHRLAGKTSRRVLVSGGEVEVQLELTIKRRRLKPHRNKEGKPYKRRSKRY